MERNEAIERLRLLVGQNLHDLAAKYSVAVKGADGKTNKGWAGHVFERFLGIPLNSAQSPNFGSWELKSIPLKKDRSGKLRFKETMAITLIDPYQVARTPFHESHLLSKLRKAVVVARTVGAHALEPSYVHSVNALDLDGELYRAAEADYELVRQCLLDESRGFSCLTGKMGALIQPRTKGAGHGSVSRAFYARPSFLEKFISLD